MKYLFSQESQKIFQGKLDPDIKTFSVKGPVFLQHGHRFICYKKVSGYENVLRLSDFIKPSNTAIIVSIFKPFFSFEFSIQLYEPVAEVQDDFANSTY